MLPLGFIIFPSLITLISNLSNQKSFLTFFFNGFVFGLGFLVIYLSWVHNPFLVYEVTKAYAFLALLLPVFLSIFFGLGFIVYKYLVLKLHIILITPFVFILIEFTISNFIYGFPWISNSLILSNNINGFYLIKYLGTITSGYLILLLFLLPLMFSYFMNIKKHFKQLLIVYSPLILIFFLPILSFESNPKKPYKEIVIEINQLVNPINSLNEKNIEEKIKNIINDSKSDYIIFAENNFPYFINKNNISNLNNLNNFIKKNKKVIIGATTVQDGDYYNSFFLLEKDKIQNFDKKILVPFGEFLPFRKYLNFMEIISGSIDFKKGNTERIITTADNLKILPIICYEIVFDKIFKDINKKEIDILVNITNDSWFGTRSGPYQHFYISRIKALVANKPLLRVSNNGISAIIDNNGKIIKSSKLNKISQLKYILKIYSNKSYFPIHKILTFYLFSIFIFLIIYSKRKEI
jgi:apolipoprotein N-acyltransferase